MTRKQFIELAFASPLMALLAMFGIEKKLYRKAYIFNDDGSKKLKEFDEIIYADYFQIVEPDGELANNGEVSLATSNPHYNKNGIMSVDIYQGEMG